MLLFLRASTLLVGEQEGYQAYKNLLQQSAKVLWEPSLTGSNLWKNRLIKENC